MSCVLKILISKIKTVIPRGVQKDRSTEKKNPKKN